MSLPAILWGFSTRIMNAVRITIKVFVKFVLRYFFLVNQSSTRTQQGFVLPTTVLLLLVVTLTVGAMTLRTLNRTGQVAGDRQQQVIYNAATPALERAKAKLEFMFDSQRDTRYPNGIPDQSFLYGMMINDGKTGGATQLDFKDKSGNLVDAYTFPDEAGTEFVFLM